MCLYESLVLIEFLQLKKLKMKELEEKRRVNQAVAKMRAEEQQNETPAERKAREQAAIEEADYENMLDAFGGDGGPVKNATVGAAASGDLETSMANLKLSTLKDHETMGDLLGERLATSNAKYALEFLKSILTKGSANLTTDHMKELTTVINVIKNDKIQAAKPKSKKKKQTGKQGYAKVERGGSSGAAATSYDDYYDDYDDFM